ncbi:anthranilate synthase component I family protein [Crocinitomicaceae bacterium]|nr:anthranilate synthase component I family protein [Crocinitomicaceae bacterium]
MKSTLAYLNSNDGSSLLALGETDRLIIDNASDVDRIQSFVDEHAGNYIFLGLSYDLNTSFLDSESNNPENMGLPLAFLWIPEIVAKIQENELLSIEQGQKTAKVESMIEAFFAKQDSDFTWNANVKARISKEQYFKTLGALRKEIQYGNIYEVNFCQEFYDDNFQMEDPEAAYFRLNNITEAPFSAFFNFDEFRILSGSPERFIKKLGPKLISQPIKGTRKRSADPVEDERLKNELLHDPKERAENVMIVDLVRNDLSRLAQTSSVKVDELFGVYSFNTVHQLISTVSCEIREDANFLDILKATFPMGSMTGAPKRSAVSLIEEHESFQRGWYSGSIGYIAPNGDFDLNVVIRSLIYNQKKKYLSCSVGGAITIQSDPEAEYEECNTKVKTILDRMHHG